MGIEQVTRCWVVMRGIHYNWTRFFGAKAFLHDPALYMCKNIYARQLVLKPHKTHTFCRLAPSRLHKDIYGPLILHFYARFPSVFLCIRGAVNGSLNLRRNEWVMLGILKWTVIFATSVRTSKRELINSKRT